ncbi:hypothetical protein [Endozoicomonas sp.]|uniref:hypothetical protein n=1 Tax=Endozoicomonas sp. TaxID=1892382 RepID=UPI003AF8588C
MKADEYLEQAELAKKLTEALQLCVDEYNNRMNPPGRTAQERQQQVANFRTWLINQKIGEPGQLLGDFHAMFTGPDGEETYQLFPVKASALNKLNDGRLGADLASALDAMKGWRPILLPGSRLNLDRLNHAQVYDAIKRHRDQHRGTIDNFDAQHQDRRRRDATMRCLRDIYSDENGARLNSKQARLEETSLRSVIPAGQVQLIRNAYHRV